ncbi:MAG: ABC transporter permease subunit [Gammaproteobacteria bacterium]|nr:ABC transporter permease subunit [Gammaproteobacteria bacterium]MCY4254937.1 ABC transporter permease subunit [Gammaproteobacteria bacterium]MCY4340154.1 ABC transporter permease subunit [Gammaproteobacteria bacterium]
MKRIIISHETRQLFRSGAFRALLLLLAGAVAFAAWSGQRSIDRQIEGANAAAAFEDGRRNKMRADTEKYQARVAAEGGEYQFASARHGAGEGPPQGTNAGVVGSATAKYLRLPPTGLAPFSVGQSDIQLSYVPVSMNPAIHITRDNELENPVNLMTGSFDIAFVVIFLLPIFILAISYDLLSSEKERGTLAMVLAHPISLKALMVSKIAARAGVLFAAVLALGLAALLAVGDGLGSFDTWARFGLWAAATLLYALFWFALSVLVNVHGGNSAANGIALAGTWLALVVVVPTLAGLLATTLYPAPSRMELTTAARQAQTEAESAYMARLSEYYYDHLEFVPEGDERAMDFLTVAMANRNAIDKAVRPLHDEFQSQLNRQESLVRRFQFISPAIMMQLALNEISGTSADRYEHFLNQAFDFRDEWSDFFTVRFLRRAPLKPSDYDQFPTFEYQEEPFATVLTRLLPSLAGMLALLGGAILIPFAGLRRYPVATS